MAVSSGAKTLEEIFGKDGVVPDFNFSSENQSASLDYIQYKSNDTELFHL